MQFRTSIPIHKSPFPIEYTSKVFALGSCFAQNMSEKLAYYKFQQLVNPFGIIFNAVSLEKLIQRIVTKKYFTPNDIFYHNELWHCFEVHSELSHGDKDVFLSTLNGLIDSTHHQITKSTHGILTLGTSWVYRHLQTDAIVANCHKVPQKAFQKELLSSAQNLASIQKIMTLVHSVNPNCRFICTVSPVRHTKDGFFENSVSKAQVLIALYTLLQTQSAMAYFPSYEILMDELRDYRFYDQDMLHPNAVAVDYIWKLFSENYCTPEAQKTMVEVDSIQKSLLHRPFNPNTTSHQQFLENLQQKMTKLTQLHPHLHF